jgi:hypothetical protein
MVCRYGILLLGVTVVLSAQDSANRSIPVQQPPAPEKEKRMFGIIPNNRTSPTLLNYKPLTTKEKFKLAREDSFDRGTFLLSAAFAGEGQLTNDNRSFGQGVKGYGHYFITSYADWSIGDYMTEAICPTLFHQDPRYFRKGTGSGMSRALYAVGQIFWTHTDSGGHMFNFSEVVGNSAAVAISQAYYPDKRTASDAAGKLAIQLGVDMASNLMKEFYPEVRRLLQHKKSGASSGQTTGVN